MELSSVDHHYAPSVTLLILCSLIWPFAALTAMPSRGRSAGPVAAVLVPLALFTAGLWIGLINTLRGMPIDSTRRLRASTAAGFAESFGILYTAAFFVALVAVFAAMRRHRAFADRMTAAMFAVLIVEIALARYAIRHLDPSLWRYPVVLAAVILALVVAIIAMIWAFLTGRGRVTSRALPYGITIMLAIAVIAGVMVWQTVQQYRAIALAG